MKKIIIKSLTISVLSLALSACGAFFQKDNTPDPTPLTKFTPETHIKQMWYSYTNFGIGSGNDYLRLVPAIDSDTIYTAAKNGMVTATNRATGSKIWRTDTRTTLTAGPTVDNGKIFIGTQDGRLIALSESNGEPLWGTQLDSEILAPPATGNGYVVVKSINGMVTALSERDGHSAWHYQQTEPDLVFRAGSAPQVSGSNAYVGFSNGVMTKLNLNSGDLQWEQRVAIPEGSFSIQRMVDIAANPVIYGNHVYVATYQGKIASLDLATGRQNWSNEISSYQGLAVDAAHVYVSDAPGNVWAFDRETGRVAWKQNALKYRDLTGPAVLGNDVVVADREGYLHLLDKWDGRFLARTRVNRFGVLATPVVDDNVIYIVTKDGHLAAYTAG